MPPAPPTPAQRRLLGISAGLGVAVLAGVLFAVTYDDLRALVIAGHAPRRFAPAYPVMFDTLVAVTVLALVMARHARWWARWPRWLLLLVLLAGAGAASVQRAVQGYGKLPHDPLKAGVAAAPHVMVLLAVWLWLGMFRHARRALARRTGRRVAAPAPRPAPPPAPAAPPEPGAGETDPYTDLIPGFGEPYEPRHQASEQPVLFPDPVFTPDPAYETAAWLPENRGPDDPVLPPPAPVPAFRTSDEYPLTWEPAPSTTADPYRADSTASARPEPEQPPAPPDRDAQVMAEPAPAAPAPRPAEPTDTPVWPIPEPTLNLRHATDPASPGAATADPALEPPSDDRPTTAAAPAEPDDLALTSPDPGQETAALPPGDESFGGEPQAEPAPTRRGGLASTPAAPTAELSSGADPDRDADEWLYGDQPEPAPDLEVTHSGPSDAASTTRPDMVLSELVSSVEDEHEVSLEPEDRAEDPDAGGDPADDLAEVSRAAAEDVSRWAAAAAQSLAEPDAELESTPPSSKFRSSPTPPRD